MVYDLHDAAREGDKEAVEQLLASGTDVNAENDVGDTPLHAPAAKGYTEVVNLLRQHGVA